MVTIHQVRSIDNAPLEGGALNLEPIKQCVTSLGSNSNMNKQRTSRLLKYRFCTPRLSQFPGT
jgi:hypothetical protein